MAFDHHSTLAAEPGKLPESLSADAVHAALNCLTSSMKGKQLARALDTLDRAVMARSPLSLSPTAPNVVHIRSKVAAAHYAVAWQILQRQALELSAVAAIIRECISAREVAAARRKARK